MNLRNKGDFPASIYRGSRIHIIIYNLFLCHKHSIGNTYVCESTDIIGCTILSVESHDVLFAYEYFLILSFILCRSRADRGLGAIYTRLDLTFESFNSALIYYLFNIYYVGNQYHLFIYLFIFIIY